jgi:hypothetical protein
MLAKRETYRRDAEGAEDCTGGVRGDAARAIRQVRRLVLLLSAFH